MHACFVIEIVNKYFYLIEAMSSQQPCVVTPVETTASCELSYVRTEKTRNTPGAAV